MNKYILKIITLGFLYAGSVYAAQAPILQRPMHERTLNQWYTMSSEELRAHAIVCQRLARSYQNNLHLVHNIRALNDADFRAGLQAAGINDNNRLDESVRNRAQFYANLQANHENMQRMRERVNRVILNKQEASSWNKASLALATTASIAGHFIPIHKLPLLSTTAKERLRSAIYGALNAALFNVSIGFWSSSSYAQKNNPARCLNGLKVFGAYALLDLVHKYGTDMLNKIIDINRYDALLSKKNKHYEAAKGALGWVAKTATAALLVREYE